MPEHWCKEHKTVWFKKGNMKGYAHPVVTEEGEQTYDENGKPQWCNEPQEKREVPSKSIDKPEMSKEDWAEKDKITRKSIERQTSLNAAVELAKKVDGVVTTGQILATARLFELYLEGKEVQKSRLVEEAKKLGAKLEREEDN